jgi:Lon protease-like protein
MAEGAVTDLRDLRVLIPETRRAIDGPTATSSAAVSASLTDVEVLGLIADATSEVILMTGGSSEFGYQLVVVERDPFYQAPIAWRTDQERNPQADVVIRAQAAINFFFQKVQNLKVSEEISDEGQTWNYSYSAQLVRDQMRFLVETRDRALAMLAAINAPLDSWVSLVANRDKMAAVYLEPYVEEIGAPVPYTGIGGGTGGDFDYRFGTIG